MPGYSIRWSGLRFFWLTMVLLDSFCYTSLSQNLQPVKIGLLIQTASSADPVKGAELAVSEFNRKNIISGRKIEIVVRSMEGPWGTGSKQAVDLIFQEKVSAIAGCVDGRNGHLVEQACTKAGVVFMSCLAGDPTLSQAFVPWFFNCAPTDQQQADAIISKIIEAKYKSVIIFTDNDYDSRYSLKYFTTEFGKHPDNKHVRLLLYNLTENKNINFQDITAVNAGCVILFCNRYNALKLIRYIAANDNLIPLLSNHFLAAQSPEIQMSLVNAGLEVLTPSLFTGNNRFGWFSKYFSEVYGSKPSLAAAYTFDAVSVLAESVNSSADSREDIQAYILKLKYIGVTGEILFDQRGNRNGKVLLINIGREL